MYIKTDVQNVIKRSPHILDKESIAVSILDAAPPPSIIPETEVDSRRLLAKRLPAAETSSSSSSVPSLLQELESYLQKAVEGLVIERLNECRKPTTWLLDLKDPVSYSGLILLQCSLSSFYGTLHETVVIVTSVAQIFKFCQHPCELFNSWINET